MRAVVLDRERFGKQGQISPLCVHSKLGYQLSAFKAKSNTRTLLQQTVFESGTGRSGLCNACSVQRLCIRAVDKHLGWAVVTVQVRFNCLVCAKQGWHLPDTSHLLCVHDRAALRVHMHRHLGVQIRSMTGPTLTAMTRLLNVQKSHSAYRKEDFFGEA